MLQPLSAGIDVAPDPSLLLSNCRGERADMDVEIKREARSRDRGSSRKSFRLALCSVIPLLSSTYVITAPRAGSRERPRASRKPSPSPPGRLHRAALGVRLRGVDLARPSSRTPSRRHRSAAGRYRPAPRRDRHPHGRLQSDDGHRAAGARSTSSPSRLEQLTAKLSATRHRLPNRALLWTGSATGSPGPPAPEHVAVLSSISIASGHPTHVGHTCDQLLVEVASARSSLAPGDGWRGWRDEFGLLLEDVADSERGAGGPAHRGGAAAVSSRREGLRTGPSGSRCLGALARPEEVLAPTADLACSEGRQGPPEIFDGT